MSGFPHRDYFRGLRDAAEKAEDEKHERLVANLAKRNRDRLLDDMTRAANRAEHSVTWSIPGFAGRVVRDVVKHIIGPGSGLFLSLRENGNEVFISW